MNRQLFASRALGEIPKILTQLDRNPHSPTYGCFDRGYWHYKVLDFPCGMSQEFVWPLALAYSLDIPGNPYHRREILREWSIAALRYTARSAHADGSADDYYPFEKASGASAFSFLACVESCAVLRPKDPRLPAFFRLRGDWLAAREESGRLSNHEALIILGLARAGRLLETGRWEKARKRRLARLLEWQNAEGWFDEYGGCDPGYLTLTISCLAALLEIDRKSTRLNSSHT